MADQVNGAASHASGFHLGGVSPHFMRLFAEGMETASNTFRDMIADITAFPDRARQATTLLTDGGDLGSLDAVLWPAAALLLGALLAAGLAGLLLRPVMARIGQFNADAGLSAVNIALRRLLIDLVPPICYLAVGLALARFLFGANGMWFPGTDVFRMVLHALLVNSAAAWLAIVIFSATFAVARPQLRLMPLDNEAAGRAAAFLRRVVILGVGSFMVAQSLFLLWFGPGVPQLILILVAVAIGVLCLKELARLRPHVSGFELVWQRFAVVSVFGLVVIWVAGLLRDQMPPFGQVLATLAILGALPLADGGVKLLLARLRQHIVRRNRVPATHMIYVPDAGGESETLHPLEESVGPDRVVAEHETARAIDAFIEVIHDASRTVLTIIAAILLAQTWSIDLAGLLDRDGGRTLLGELVDAGGALLIGWFAWRLFETGLTVQLSRESTGVYSRARTIKPLLRGVGRLVIGATALMAALSALGVNIAPLLASAGVVGIAVGFGAQTLVKDLFSGVFFLIEDVFRIGEYIEGGGTAKGTVEKITVRTVALRHQNGPLHFVPYGSLGTVRNNSRDWVIDKFEFPLPVSVDSERVRKMVKKIGEAMLEDPDLSSVILMPLKAKLYRIQPGAKIFRCKVQTPPDKQWEVRAAAYQRIEAALREADIPFAEGMTPQITVNNTLPVPVPDPVTGQTKPAEAA